MGISSSDWGTCSCDCLRRLQLRGCCRACNWPPPSPGAPAVPPGYALVPYAPGALSAPSPYAYGQHAPMNVPAPSPSTTSPSWDQAAFIAAMNSLTTQDAGNEWIFDSGESAHMSASSSSLSSIHPSLLFPSITLGNGSTVPVSCVGTSSIPSSTSPLLLS